MKRSNNFRQTIILIGLSFWFTSCGRLAPKAQNENLPAKQNTNLNGGLPNPAATIEETPTVTPTPAANINVAANVNSFANSPGNVSVNSANGNSLPVTVDKLIIPVAGVKRENLFNTFKDVRSEGRVHDAIDIPATGGTPVLAAADGEIARFFDSARGGITIYQYSRDKKLIYYYAHLRARAENLQEHQFVRQGAVIGYVGDTGNAGEGNFHLHFAVWIINDPKRFWEGTNINPYELLR